MADVNVGDVVRTVLRSTLNGISAVENVTHWKLTGPGGISATEALADAADWWDTVLDQLESHQTVGLTYDDIYCYNETQDAPLGTTDVSGHTNGSNTTHSELPAQVAGGMYGLSGVSRVVGKKFFGGFTEAANDAGGLIHNTPLAALANVAAIIWDSTITYNGHDWQGGVFRRALGTLIPVVEAFANNVWYTQRRRRRGVGA